MPLRWRHTGTSFSKRPVPCTKNRSGSARGDHAAACSVTACASRSRSKVRGPRVGPGRIDGAEMVRSNAPTSSRMQTVENVRRFVTIARDLYMSHSIGRDTQRCRLATPTRSMRRSRLCHATEGRYFPSPLPPVLLVRLKRTGHGDATDALAVCVNFSLMAWRELC